MSKGFNGKKILELLICLIAFFSNSVFSQLPNNRITIQGLFNYYPATWTSATRGGSISYERNISNSSSIGGTFNYAWGDLEQEIPDYGYIYQTIFYNDVILKDLKTTDLFFSHCFLKDKKEKILFSGYAGPSFIWGRETILVSVWYEPPFEESMLDGFGRHELGFNIGEELNYYPVKSLGIGCFTKFRAYTKHESDLTIGINISLRFVDPKFKKNSVD